MFYAHKYKTSIFLETILLLSFKFKKNRKLSNECMLFCNKQYTKKKLNVI